MLLSGRWSERGKSRYRLDLIRKLEGGRVWVGRLIEEGCCGRREERTKYLRVMANIQVTRYRSNYCRAG
jgi:hypothetical protein